VRSYQRIACLGGVYSNYLALQSALQDIATRDVEAVFCLGDLGAFGPHPDRVFPILQSAGVVCLQGNYDDSIGNMLDNCQCGYTDPRDNYFAQISYDYTLANTGEDHRAYLRSLPGQIRIRLGAHRTLLCHGSPRRVNEFLWESTTSSHFLAALCDEFECDTILATHSGIKWQRRLTENRNFVNVGVLGRPENDGTPRVWYTILDGREERLDVEFVPLHYDYRRLADEMEEEGLPAEFAATVTSGWWTTCLEILPARERRAGIH
jgi:predicted phosphodiesterase